MDNVSQALNFFLVGQVENLANTVVHSPVGYGLGQIQERRFIMPDLVTCPYL